MRSDCALAGYCGNGGHDNHGRGEKVPVPKVKEIGSLSVPRELHSDEVLRIRKRCAAAAENPLCEASSPAPVVVLAAISCA
jgi:hypothetical protein